MILDSCPSSYNCLSFALVFLDCFIKKTCQNKFFSDRLAQSEVMWFNVLDFNNVLGHYSNLYIYYLVLIFIPKWLVKIILNVENHSSYVCMRPSLKWDKIKKRLCDNKNKYKQHRTTDFCMETPKNDHSGHFGYLKFHTKTLVVYATRSCSCYISRLGPLSLYFVLLRTL